MTGLEPETWYYYRFHFHAGTSRVGRTRTAPAASSTPDHLRFGVVSCANLQAGYFTAYRGLAKRTDLHAVLHLGDYLYEYGPGGYGYGKGDVDIRRHVPGARDGLAGRLPAAARAVQDRPGPAGPARGVPLDHHLGRPRGHQRPVGQRRREPPAGDRGRLQGPPGPRPPRVRRVDAGADGRHRAAARRRPALPPAALRPAGRDQHARPAHLPQRAGADDRCPTPVPAAEAEVSDPSRTITGTQQMHWLKDVARPDRPAVEGDRQPGDDRAGRPSARCPTRSSARSTTSPACCPRTGLPYNVDQWDGYTADRREVFEHIRNHQVRTRCSSPATSTPAGPASCRYDPRPTRSATRPASSSCAPR